MTATAERLATGLAERYRIEREIGQGGMATVYLAEDLKHKRKVALKVLKPELAAVVGAERFLHEIALTATLHIHTSSHSSTPVPCLHGIPSPPPERSEGTARDLPCFTT